MTRRDLIQKIFVGGSVILITPAILSECTKDATTNPPSNSNPVVPPPSGSITVDLSNANYAALNTAGGSIVIQGIIIANTGSDNFIALSSTCTHQGCTVGYNASANNFPCPCHGSLYSSTGSVINGPATAPLKTYPISKTGTVLTITV